RSIACCTICPASTDAKSVVVVPPKSTARLDTEAELVCWCLALLCKSAQLRDKDAPVGYTSLLSLVPAGLRSRTELSRFAKTPTRLSHKGINLLNKGTISASVAKKSQVNKISSSSSK